MKRIMSWMLALLMLVMPVFSMAETTEAAVEEGLAELSALDQDFFKKYMDQGQRTVCDVSLKLGESVEQMLPEEQKAGIIELLDVLKIEMTAQNAEGMSQSTLRLLVNDEGVFNLTAASSEKGLFVGSALLGDKVALFTPEQMSKLLDMVVQSLIEQGTLTQEQVDEVKAIIKAFRDDPSAALLALIGNPDPTALQAALQDLIGGEAMTMSILEEVPEEVTIDAAYLLTITLGKEKLANVLTETAKLVWSMPITQKIASFNGGSLTEEKLISAFNSVTDALAEDLVIRVYLTSDQMTRQILSDIKLKSGESVIPTKLSVISETVDETSSKTTWTFEAVKDEENKVAASGMTVANVNPAAGSMDMNVDVLVTESGSGTSTMKETVNVTWTSEEKAKTSDVHVKMDVNNAGAEPAGMEYTISTKDADLDDHAEKTVEANILVDGMGQLMTFRVDARTDLAEAYIVTDDAVQPLAMSEEEQQAFLGEIQNNMMPVLMTALTKLPENAQNLVISLMGGQNGQ